MDLPETYYELGARYKDLEFINIMCDSPIRIYRYENNYHAFISSIEGMVPLVEPTAMAMSNMIYDIIKRYSVVDMTYCYPNTITKKKEKKILKITGEYEAHNVQRALKSYLILLL